MEWNIGILEDRNDGFEKKVRVGLGFELPLFQYSTIPLFQVCSGLA
jgi:hypothetical protein